MRFIFAFLFIFCSLYLKSQNKLNNIDFSHLYDPNSPVKCKLKLLNTKKDSIKVYIKLSINSSHNQYKELKNKNKWKFSYGIVENYKQKKPVYKNSIQETPEYKLSENKLIFILNIPNIKNSSEAYFFLQYYKNEKGKLFIKDYPIKFTGKKLTHDVLLFSENQNIPVFNNYISNKDTLLVSNAESTSEKIYIKRYENNMKVAYPPMVYAPSKKDRKLLPDTIYKINSNNSFILINNGTYQISNDTSFANSQTFIVRNKSFPKYVKPNKLVKPLIYIASDTERKNLFNAQKPKYSLDDFWLSLGGNKAFSRKLIRFYYRQIYKANRLFTHYKPGWKTDKGMIYIVFDKPEKVKKTTTKEKWYYNKNVEFVFKKKINHFNEYYFELNRSQDYSNIWFKNVEKWREGKYLKN